jgi:hypothetical protein
LICASSANIKIAVEMIAAGESDQAIANKINISRPAVQRHRKNHVEKPALAIAEAANRGSTVRMERERRVQAAEAGDPVQTFIGLNAIVSDLRRVGERLERTAAGAESGGQRLVVAQLASQQHKSAEVRAKLGQVGGYAPAKLPAGDGRALFVINIHFSGERGGCQTIEMAPTEAIVEALPPPDDSDDDGIEDLPCETLGGYQDYPKTRSPHSVGSGAARSAKSYSATGMR